VLVDVSPPGDDFRVHGGGMAVDLGGQRLTAEGSGKREEGSDEQRKAPRATWTPH
jgi:hypothetical protein